MPKPFLAWINDAKKISTTSITTNSSLYAKDTLIYCRINGRKYMRYQDEYELYLYMCTVLEMLRINLSEATDSVREKDYMQPFIDNILGHINNVSVKQAQIYADALDNLYSTLARDIESMSRIKNQSLLLKKVSVGYRVLRQCGGEISDIVSLEIKRMRDDGGLDVGVGTVELSLNNYDNLVNLIKYIVMLQETGVNITQNIITTYSIESR